MTLRDLARAMVRCWPIVLVGMVCTAALGYLAVDDRGVYWTRTDVVFLAPASQVNPNSLKTTSEDLVVTAGAIGKAISGPGRVTKYSSPDANLVGTGVREGWSIRLQDTGGQWATNYATQVLVLEVVGGDEEVVRRWQRELVRQITTELDDRQRTAGVDPLNDITVNVAAESTVFHHIGGSRVRALAMTGLLGGSATLAAVVLLARRASRRVPDDVLARGATWSDTPVSPVP